MAFFAQAPSAGPSNGIPTIKITGNDINAPNVTLDHGTIVILNFVLFAAGLIAVVFVIVAGFQYIMSGGDSKAVTTAKNTMLNAIIGLVIVLISLGLVNFVLGRL